MISRGDARFRGQGCFQPRERANETAMARRASVCSAAMLPRGIASLNPMGKAARIFDVVPTSFLQDGHGVVSFGSSVSSLGRLWSMFANVLLDCRPGFFDTGFCEMTALD